MNSAILNFLKERIGKDVKNIRIIPQQEKIDIINAYLSQKENKFSFIVDLDKAEFPSIEISLEFTEDLQKFESKGKLDTQIRFSVIVDMPTKIIYPIPLGLINNNFKEYYFDSIMVDPSLNLKDSSKGLLNRAKYSKGTDYLSKFLNRELNPKKLVSKFKLRYNIDASYKAQMTEDLKEFDIIPLIISPKEGKASSMTFEIHQLLRATKKISEKKNFIPKIKLDNILDFVEHKAPGLR